MDVDQRVPIDRGQLDPHGLGTRKAALPGRRGHTEGAAAIAL
jgi:hypothetical protein